MERLVSMFRGNGWSSARGWSWKFAISSDVNCGAYGALWSTIESLSPIYWFSKYFFLKHLVDLKSIGKSFSKIQNRFWLIIKFNRFGVGQPISPLYKSIYSTCRKIQMCDGSRSRSPAASFLWNLEELAGGGSMAVAVGVSDMWQMTCDMWQVHNCFLL